MKYAGAIVGLTLLGGLSAPLAWTFPEPAIVSRAWQFDFSHDHPRPIAVRDAEGRVHWYWYLTYKLVNNTDTERVFIPDFVVATDDGQITPAGKGVAATVFEAVKARVGNRLLERPDQVVDKILLGEDHARESVVIWPADRDADLVHVSVFIAGLSGETATVTDPVTGEAVVLRKTLMLEYDMPGRPDSPQQQTVLFKGQSWVMR